MPSLTVTVMVTSEKPEYVGLSVATFTLREADDPPCPVTVTVTVAEWLKEPRVPVTVTVYVPAPIDDGNIDSVEETDPPEETVNEDGLSEVVKPFGADAVRATVPLNPLSDVTVMIGLPEPLGAIVKADGEADIEKSGLLGGGGSGKLPP
jgi:hypothetical protein